MTNIDYIMDLLDWNRSNQEQKKGLKLAEDVKCISVFLQPGSPYGKNVWENCAKVLAARSDDELKPHLGGLLEWLQDMNWPGADCILERLRNFSDIQSLETFISIFQKQAKALDDEDWEYNLMQIRLDSKKLYN